MSMDASRAGLCATCMHAQVVVSSKGSTFMLCQLSRTNPAFPQYPPLPVVSCSGYAPLHAARPNPG
jgi:hypothetical protein